LPRKIYRRIRNREKADTFLTLKIKGYESREQIRKKPIYVHGLPEDKLMKIVDHFRNIHNVMEFERNMEKELNLEKGDITLAEMPHIEYVKPQNIPLFDVSRGWTSLFEQEPDFVDHYDRQVERGYALRVGVRSGLRKRAYKNYPKVLDALLSLT